jgi:hypothetical protein
MLDGSLCSQGFRSRRALVQHLAISHHSYQRGDVASCTLQDIASDYERCLVLMLRFPECRNPNNSGLFTKACYYYLGLSYSNGCITGKDGEPIEYSLMMKVLKRLESFRRRAQEIRAWDRDTYHGEDGSAQIEHSCILPSEADQALASERASVIRSYEAGRARLIGETFIPSAML